MSKSKKVFLLGLSIPLLLLAGCVEKEAPVINPDKEPNEITQTVEDENEKELLSIATISELYVDDKMLPDYVEDFARMGYDEPFKEILLAEGEAQTLKGLVYEVSDGFAMIEYDVENEEVVALTGYQTEQQINLQEMKTAAYAKENEAFAETDATKKVELEKEAEDMWAEIGELESTPE